MSDSMATLGNLTLRLASSEDSAQVFSLVERVLAEYGLTMEYPADDDLLDIDRHYTAAGGQFYLVLDDQFLVGTIALHHVDDRECELRRMYLVASHRRRGIGEALLRWMLEQARSSGYTAMRLETSSRLTRAVRLYESFGFKACPGTSLSEQADVFMSRVL